MTTDSVRDAGNVHENNCVSQSRLSCVLLEFRFLLFPVYQYRCNIPFPFCSCLIILLLTGSLLLILDALSSFPTSFLMKMKQNEMKWFGLIGIVNKIKNLFSPPHYAKSWKNGDDALLQHCISQIFYRFEILKKGCWARVRGCLLLLLRYILCSSTSSSSSSYNTFIFAMWIKWISLQFNSNHKRLSSLCLSLAWAWDGFGFAGFGNYESIP